MSGRPIDHVVHLVSDLDKAGTAFERLGFRLTPTAYHEDRMGTRNRLAQFRGRNFIELLEVDRPDLLQPHDFAAAPPFFGFGAHNKEMRRFGEGMTMLVFAGDDGRADIERFSAAGLQTYAPFDFERKSKLPDGTEVTVAFTLAFVTSPDMPRVAFFVCENRAQEYFWKPDFQEHDNGAESISAVYFSSRTPERDAEFIGRMFGGEVRSLNGGFAVACGPRQETRILQPDAIAAHDRTFRMPEDGSTVMAGLELHAGETQANVPSSSAHGAFITWTTA
ncbi:VOC family protein [Nisaea acidiphila]|uniref:VOC family protein n=1 Tax=Nisaea acidiphila TaxID=1862145 RepID=A0A9J7B1G0_9PROT|nr:VOC family protein [Nisaea acidiphila]UUX51501.1 VOC family protein [Nisaea acidiphila]